MTEVEETESITNVSTFYFFHIIFSIGSTPVFSSIKTKLYIAYVWFAQVCSWIMCLTLIIESWIHFDEPEMAASLCNFLSAIWTQLYLMFYRTDVVNVLKLTNSFTWDDKEAKDPDTGGSSIAAWIPRIKKFAFNLFIIIWIVHVSQTALRIIFSDERHLTVRAWYPFDTTSNPGYSVAFCHQLYASLVLSIYMHCFPPFYATLVCIACSQLEKLRVNLSRVNQDQELLNACIRHHQKIIEYMNAIEVVFAPCLLGWFLLITTGLCISAFTAVVSLGNFTWFLQALMIYTLLLANVLEFCWFGSELTDQAQKVSDAAFGMDWLGSSIPFQRCIVFMIAQANKEFKLTAGKLMPVNKITMKNMIEQSVSFFMFLVQVKDPKD